MNTNTLTKKLEQLTIKAEKLEKDIEEKKKLLIDAKRDIYVKELEIKVANYESKETPES